MAGIPISTLQRMALEGDRQASSMLDRFERRVLWHLRQSRQYRDAMAYEASGDGRGSSNGVGVNGTEIRAGRRWQSTPLDSVSAPVRDANGRIVGFQPIDRTVYNVAQDGTRTAWIDPTLPDAAPVKSRRRELSSGEAFAARLRSIATPADRHDFTAQ